MTSQAEVDTPLPAADIRAREVEEQMTDDERFSLLVSVMGTNDVLPVRDPRIPVGTPMSGGYVPGVERLGVSVTPRPRLLVAAPPRTPRSGSSRAPRRESLDAVKSYAEAAS